MIYEFLPEIGLNFYLVVEKVNIVLELMISGEFVLAGVVVMSPMLRS
jgi:hypothetical protein